MCLLALTIDILKVREPAQVGSDKAQTDSLRTDGRHDADYL